MMFKKFCLYAAAFIAIAVYVLAENETFMRFYTNKIMFSDNKNFRNDNYRYGDLYAMSYLKDYKFPLSNFTDSLHRQTDTAKNTDLWLIGDSFLSVVTGDVLTHLVRSATAIIVSSKRFGFFKCSLFFEVEIGRAHV